MYLSISPAKVPGSVPRIYFGTRRVSVIHNPEGKFSTRKSDVEYLRPGYARCFADICWRAFFDAYDLQPRCCGKKRHDIPYDSWIIELFIAQKYWWLLMDGSERFQVGLRPGGNFESLTSHGFPLWQRFSSNSIILWCIRSANSHKISQHLSVYKNNILEMSQVFRG